MSDDLLTPTQLAKKLNVPLGTIRAWRAAGKGPPAIRLGKHLRFNWTEDVVPWIEARREQVPTTTQGPDRLSVIRTTRGQHNRGGPSAA